LIKVGFKLDGVPQLAGSADDVDVALSGLTPTDAIAHGLTIALDGAAEDVQVTVDAWRGAQGKKVRATAASGPANKLSFTGAKLTWTRAFGQTARLEATDVQGDADGGSNAVHLTTDKLMVTTGRVSYGPWRTSFERDTQGTRTHVELDPVIRGGPQATYVRDAAGVVSVRVTVPREPLSRVGVTAKAVGLAGDADVEATLNFDEAATGASTLRANVTLTKATFSGLPIDAKLELNATGDATRGLDVKNSTLTAGPLRATVTGTVTLFADGARMALAWRAAPIPCAVLVKELTAQTLTSALGAGLGGELGKLADQVGGQLGVKVTGDAAASGLITLDSRDTAAAAVSMTSNQTCGLGLF
jgi:hypothetical protein